MLPYNDFAANGNNPLNSVSQPKGALQNAGPLPHTPIPAAEKGMGGEQKPEKVSLSLD